MKNFTLLLISITFITFNSLKAQTWSPQISGTNSDLRTVLFPENDDTGYAAGSGGTILKTSNGGNSWTTLTSGVNQDIFEMYFLII